MIHWKNNFPAMADILVPSRYGKASLEKYRVDECDFRARFYDHMKIGEEYMVLKVNEQLMMSDTPMERESNQIKEVMKRALIDCNNKMTVILRLSKNEMDSYKTLNADKKDAVKFWSVLDEYGVKFALDTPADYVWCINKLKEFNGDKEQVSKAWIDKMFKTWGLTCSSGMPHNINNPWLSHKDYLHYLSLIGFTSTIQF